VLPRVLSLAEIVALQARINVETEVFVFGGLCVMAEGRCALSSYVTGKSPNLTGVCSPAEAVSYEERDGVLSSRLNGFALDQFAAGESAGYPTLCKARLVCGGESSYLFEEPVSLNAIGLLAQMAGAGVAAVKIEGRQRGKAYVAKAVAAFRAAIDQMAAAGAPQAEASASLEGLSEGGRQTAGAYKKQWR
jgi:O2-independent ubiquinone biosynthesis protein UbiU